MFLCDAGCRHIRGSSKLQNDYAPNAPGAALHRLDEQNAGIEVNLLSINSKLAVLAGALGLPTEGIASKLIVDLNNHPGDSSVTSISHAWAAIAALALFTTQSAVAQDKVRILVHAFIPSTYPEAAGELLPLPGTNRQMVLLDFSKKTALAAALKVLNEPLQHCYAIDDRSFSDKPDASARVTGDFVLLAGASPKVDTALDKRFKAGVTRKYDCKTGKELAAKSASVSACVLGAPAFADGKTQLVMDCKASDPLVPYIPEKFTPDLHFNGVFTYSGSDKTIAFKGDVGAFPSFEAYASLNGGPFKPLFRVAPEKGVGGPSLIDLLQHINVRKLDVKPVKL